MFLEWPTRIGQEFWICFRHPDEIKKERATVIGLKGNEVFVQSASITTWVNLSNNCHKDFVWLEPYEGDNQ